MNQFKRVTKEFIKNLLHVDQVTNDQLATFQMAFVHPSVVETYGAENVKKYLGCQGDYEELEFLGDRVMELVVGEYLYDQTRTNRNHKKKFRTPKNVEFKDGSAKFLTGAKSRLVKSDTFADCANRIGLAPYICVVSKNAMEDDWDQDYYASVRTRRTVHSKAIMEDVFEAFICACYEGFGWHITRDFAQDIIVNANWEDILYDNNYKDKIQRYYTSIEYGSPEYADLKKVEISSGMWTFTSCVLSPVKIELYGNIKVICYQSKDSNSRKKKWLMQKTAPPSGFVTTGSSGYIAGVGTGRKLKEAEQNAAMNAMINFGTIAQF